MRLGLLLLLLPTLAWAQAEKKNPLDPQMAAVAEVCLQGNSIACMGTADAVTPGKEARALWLLTAELARANPAPYAEIEDFSAEQAIELAEYQAGQIGKEAGEACLEAVIAGDAEASQAACAPAIELYALGCFLGIASDCMRLAKGSAQGTTLPLSAGNSLAWAADACLWGDAAACEGLGASVMPTERFNSNRSGVWALLNRSDVAAEFYEEVPGPKDALPFRADVLDTLAQGATGPSPG